MDRSYGTMTRIGALLALLVVLVVMGGCSCKEY